MSKSTKCKSGKLTEQRGTKSHSFRMSFIRVRNVSTEDWNFNCQLSMHSFTTAMWFGPILR